MHRVHRPAPYISNDLVTLGSNSRQCLLFSGHVYITPQSPGVAKSSTRFSRAAQTVLGVYLKRTSSRDTSASSVLGVPNDYAQYKSTHTLTHSPVLAAVKAGMSPLSGGR